MNSRTSWIIPIVGLALVAAIAYFTLPREMVNKTIPTVSSVKIERENAEVQYKLDLEYPVLSGLSNSRVESKINKEIQKNVETLGVAFAADAEDLPTALLAQFGKDARSELSMRYKVEYLDAHLISILFSNSVSSIGAAHPGNFTTTLLYDLDTGKVLSFGDLFVSTFDFPAFATLKSRELLIKKLGVTSPRALIDEGTLPTFENFKSYLLTKEGLTLYFDQSQVAPSAAGVQEVTIPFAELSGKLKQQYLLSE